MIKILILNYLLKEEKKLTLQEQKEHNKKYRDLEFKRDKNNLSFLPKNCLTPFPFAFISVTLAIAVAGQYCPCFAG